MSFAPSSPASAVDSGFTETELELQDGGHERDLSKEFSDPEGEDGGEHGDYSTLMEEVLQEGDEDEDEPEDEDEDEDDEEGFVYSGVDAGETSMNYNEQLLDVLGPEREEDEKGSELEVEKSLLYEETNDNSDPSFSSTSPQPDVLSDHWQAESPRNHSVSLSPLPETPSRSLSLPGTDGRPWRVARPFLHPSVSRLRSFTPQSLRGPSLGSGVSATPLVNGEASTPSQLSVMSRSSSVSGLREGQENGSKKWAQAEREVFRWSSLRNLGKHFYVKASSKAKTVLGAQSLGSPMVMAANGLLCIGTDAGKIAVFDFKQTLICICGNDALSNVVGPVTAVALSHDHTFVASGHVGGHILLFDLNHPETPARHVPPSAPQAVSSGRQEGHLPGSRIVSVGFLAGRHTAIVSADEHGLAFFHSLGKVLFVEATDILRILGRYPDEDRAVGSDSSRPGPIPRPLPFRRRRNRNTILAMLPLPLGTAPYPTDAYNVVALLTPTKLVVVGLKPTPKTWFRRLREDNDEGSLRSRLKGAMSWWPSVLPTPPETTKKTAKNRPQDKQISPTPVLAYSWANEMTLIRVSELKIKQPSKNARTGKVTEIEVGTVVFEETGKWTAEEDILALQWLNANQIIVLTPTTLHVYDAPLCKAVERVPFDAFSLVSPTLSDTPNGRIAYTDATAQVAHSVRVYKGKLFLLGYHDITIGTLLTWADRILSFVEQGDFLSAIELTRTYYTGEAPGNKNGLPDDPRQRQTEIGEEMRELMTASASYTFSDDRMQDGTHYTPDARGVDRTSLFEGLVSTCARACLALDDFEFLFEDLFQEYEDYLITRIFLEQLEPFILDGSIKYVPPRITQRLIAMHQDDSHADLAERVIWHIDPACLDINQAILLCQKYKLYDALLYVYTRALRDYVSPLVELMGLMRKVRQYRSPSPAANGDALDDLSVQRTILDAYKIYPYIGNVLSGLTYPSEEPLGEEESFKAKKDLYSFLFSGRSMTWPRGEAGRLILTSIDESGAEPTYPYARLLLQFDAESFLNTLDIAFEDAYLNEESNGISRLVIVKILLETSSSPDMSSADTTLVNIFVARNVPKYPQFIHLPPTALHNILLQLAQDLDSDTREDRQLAAEYLLSIYSPHDSDSIHNIFEKAGFYRILRSWYRHDQQWHPLISTYLYDPDLHASEVFTNIADVVDIAKRLNKGSVPPNLSAMISDALPQLLQSSVTRTAFLVEKYFPGLHQKALDSLGLDAAHDQFTYLRYLLGPPDDENELITRRPKTWSSANVPPTLRLRYLSLQCQYDREKVIPVLQSISFESLDWSEVERICEGHEVYDAVVWASRDRPREALSKAEIFEQQLSLRLVKVLSSRQDVGGSVLEEVDRDVAVLQSIGRIGISICMEHSQGSSATEVPLEDIWFQLLSSQVHSIQSVSSCCSSAESSLGAIDESGQIASNLERKVLMALRSLVQETFAALVSVSSTRVVSFPRLFKRLVETATRTPTSLGARYTEFRAILTGMLESYRSDGDMLVITKHLVDRDLFETMDSFTRERARGWAPVARTCFYCRKDLMETCEGGSVSAPGARFTVSRRGVIYHDTCSKGGT